MNLHLEWRDEMLSVIESASIALRGLPSESKLGAAVSVLKNRLKKLEEHHYNLGALRQVVESYLRKQIGSMHDHFDEEVEQMCEDWLSRNPKSYIWSNTAARVAISTALHEYKRKYPFKSDPPA